MSDTIKKIYELELLGSSVKTWYANVSSFLGRWNLNSDWARYVLKEDYKLYILLRKYLKGIDE